MGAFSNSRTLLRNGFKGLLIEGQKLLASAALKTAALEELNLEFYNTFATPENIIHLLRASNIPKIFGLISVDIDSFDYYVLESVLREFRPQLICVEINERIPPGLSYILPRNTMNLPRDSTIISSAGISNYEKMLHGFDYSLVALEYNNLIAISNEVTSGKNYAVCNVSARDLWNKGFYGRLDWQEKMPWNIPFKSSWDLPARECCAALRKCFSELYGWNGDISVMDSVN